MFDLPDSWVWDYWFADDGERYHLFFLYASRALHDPEARHYRASVGHAVSTDLVEWTQVADALVRSDAPAFDELATWTGSVVRHPDGTWFMFYTGATLAADGKNVQRIGYATSTDLFTWTKAGAPVLEATGPWYEKLSSGAWHDEAFRDPWVFADPDGNGWHMLITARAPEGPVDGRGVVGHAWSADLRTWELREPLSAPTADGFGQLEVLQAEIVDGRPVLLFSCLKEQSTASRRAAAAGTWAVPAESLLGPFDIDTAYPLTDERLYVGRLLQRRSDGEWLLFAFRNIGEDGRFQGGVTDPMPVRWEGDRLVRRERVGASA
ncbi:family 43 glycosylhydrolase [Microbacterium trichothecenolyticum]|uniref:Family 43 glycosylhydrolase n=1 Tax=Microbacterium ureisolvens TaxID=2781186 RepID=A0ABS7I555_9MICO|nr:MULTISPECIES: family 43 glycosylhydrolase [Microbacterium]MBW9111705.1 family 43 glycosylhydrolase [Microbacterium ureisolvens]MBW9119481.1 family 43 glycosylhydrolase [Microbacterium trichothecenolyticum]